MAKKIFWMSWHKPHHRQVKALCEMFGQDTVVEQESRPFDDARQIAKRYRDGEYDDMVIEEKGSGAFFKEPFLLSKIAV